MFNVDISSTLLNAQSSSDSSYPYQSQSSALSSPRPTTVSPSSTSSSNSSSSEESDNQQSSKSPGKPRQPVVRINQTWSRILCSAYVMCDMDMEAIFREARWKRSCHKSRPPWKRRPKKMWQMKRSKPRSKITFIPKIQPGMRKEGIALEQKKELQLSLTWMKVLMTMMMILFLKMSDS